MRLARITKSLRKYMNVGNIFYYTNNITTPLPRNNLLIIFNPAGVPSPLPETTTEKWLLHHPDFVCFSFLLYKYT